MNGRTSARTETAGKQTATGGGGTVEQQIKALHAQLMEATLKHDPGFLEKYRADDYMAIRNDGLATCGWRIDTEAVKRLDSRNALR
jgi:hypothetical protein